MKITITRTELVAALGVVKNAATGKGTLPALSNVLLSATGKKVDLTCTDLDLTITTSVEALVEEAGKCSVNAALFHGVMSSLTGPEVQLEALTHDLKIVCGASRYKLGTLDADELPPKPKLKDPKQFDLPQSILRSLLAETSFCQGRDESRHVICSSFLRLNGSITAAATDGRRVAVEEAPLEEEPKPSAAAEMILPVKAVRELLRLLPAKAPEEKDAPTVDVAVTDNAVQFCFGDTTIISKLIEGQYPDYRKVLPTALPDGTPVGRSDLLQALKRVNLLADTCTLDFAGQTLTIRGRGTKDAPGEAVESLLIPKTNDVKVNFNVQYLIEALEAVDADEVILFTTDATSPITFKVKGKPWTYVAMCMTPDAPAAAKPEEKTPAAPAAKK